jgi:cyclopropane fatty-acyl-phospholipid synthase-like methyltransferase
VAEATGLAPGRALDVGSGEGADAIWLAARGWRVTGLDFSTVALEKAAGHAAAAGVGDRVEWCHADLRTWRPDGPAYDLVTSQFMHQPDGAMTALVGRLAEAVAPGGTLLVVGHHPRDHATGLRHGVPDMLFTAEDLLPALDPAAWEVEAVETRPRQAPGPDGGTVTVHDAVLRARRR